MGGKLEDVSEFKYLELVFEVSSTDKAEYYIEMASVRKLACPIRSLLNNRS